MTTPTTHILHHTSAFISTVLSKSELRRHLLSTLQRELSISSHVNLKHLNLVIDTLENAIAVSSPTTRSSSLNLAEKLLLPLPENPISHFLLSIIHTLRNQPINAALSLLQIFHSNPSLARTEIAPVLYENLFSVHLFPVFQWFNEQRTMVLSSTLPDHADATCDSSVSFQSVVLPCSKLLSRISEDQTLKLRVLEREYEEVIDENCRAVAKHFKEVLENKNGNPSLSSPLLMVKSSGNGDKVGSSQEEIVETTMPVLENGRYNPIWAERENSIEFLSSSSSNSSMYPQRVFPMSIKHRKSWKKLTITADLNSSTELDPTLEENLPCSSSESEAENKEKNKKMDILEPRRSQTQREKMQKNFAETKGSLDYLMEDYDNQSHGNGKQAPPKDFVCPITSYLFDDPVTLETGQTYERKAIEEWFNRGNSTCPITRQQLQSTQLPKTNYVLKRLIASWKENNPDYSISSPIVNPYAETEPESKPEMPSTSPDSVITHATVDGMINELRHAIENLYLSEILEESEMAVLRIQQFWKEENLGIDIHSMLSKPPIINGFMEILFNSVDPQVLKASVFLLTEMGSRDNAVVQTLTRVDSDVECVMALFQKGLTEAIVLIYLLKPFPVSLAEMAMLESLLAVFTKKEEDLVKMCMSPMTAAVLLLADIIAGSEERTGSSVANTVMSDKEVMGSLVRSLRAEIAEERIAAVEILLRCMKEDAACRNTIAENADVSAILGSFNNATDGQRFKIVQFFSELVKLNRRIFIEQILYVIKEEGSFSTMHTLLIYLQTASEEQSPVVAGLLLQLDLLVEPIKMSIYREEAMDALISCLRNTDSPASQIAAAEKIVSLQGRFNSTGQPLTREILLKRSGLGRSSKSFIEMDQISDFSEESEINPEEELAAEKWERKVASVLVGHDFGLIFEALADCLRSRNAELSSPCFISATWLVYMLSILPDTGIHSAARVCLLKRFISILKTAKDTDDKVLSMLAINSFIQFPDGLRDLTTYARDVLKCLRELKKSSQLASEMLKVLVDDQESQADMWMHKELTQINCNENGEVFSIICLKDKIISGHADGTMKVWKVKNSMFQLVQETQEHTKAVTSLVVSESGERLYSGSLDRTTKVWSIGNASIHCAKVHDMKDQVHSLVVSDSTSCFIPQGTGVKVQSMNGELKLLNSKKYVKCLALAHGKLYCGCHDNSIQELDLATDAVNNIQIGSKKLLGKANPIHAMKIHGEYLYAASSSLDGVTVKVWNTSDYSVVGSLRTALEVRAMAVSSQLIYLGSKGGALEIWDRKKLNRLDNLQTCTSGNGRVLCMALDGNEEILVIGTSDGQIQAWGI
ncbi:hypothetical protein L6164_013116 [Bauhinia variegata]|uniref:Uncharacterized protein n=1 Tax=Bauhinia variegata TaxID=167791 RepID=A0ACB9PC34_BAUVA|nr:hypothetical protein L6164_013116 [Bauhinia variegata]